MKVAIQQIIYWLAALIPIPLVILSPAVWPPSKTDMIISFALLAFGLVASFKLITIYKNAAYKALPIMLSSLYSFCVIFAIYVNV